MHVMVWPANRSRVTLHDASASRGTAGWSLFSVCSNYPAWRRCFLGVLLAGCCSRCARTVWRHPNSYTVIYAWFAAGVQSRRKQCEPYFHTKPVDIWSAVQPVYFIISWITTTNEIPIQISHGPLPSSPPMHSAQSESECVACCPHMFMCLFH